MTQAKHLWVVPLAIAMIVAFAGWWANEEVRLAVQQKLGEDLEATLEANVTSLEIWMRKQKQIAQLFAEEPRLKSIALELFDRAEAVGTNRTALLEFGRVGMNGDRLQEFRERFSLLDYTNAPQLVSTNFIVVTEPGRGGGRPVAEAQQWRYAELFASGEPILITPFKTLEFTPPPGGRRGSGGLRGARGQGFSFRGDRNARPNIQPWWTQVREVTVMCVAAPIRDSKGSVRGALALTINPDAEFTRMLSVAGRRNSSETIAFDQEGILISRSRFDGDLKRLGMLGTNETSALTLHLQDPGGDLTAGYKPADTNAARPLIHMVAEAISGRSRVAVEPFRDYRGVPVVAAWRWLEDYDFGVGAKVDASEAYRPLRMVRTVFTILFLLLVLASVIIFVFTYWQVVWRRRVTEAELKARQLGQYKLEQKIGEGGMGVVYRAHHAMLRRDTALKLLPPDKADPVAISRFEREVRLTCRLTHPNTIQVFDYGHTPDGIFYYAMEYLDGLNLNDLVERYGAQPDERVMFLLAQVCDSLAEAHGMGLIHRDIKPANIFTCDRGGVPDYVKVLDFGLVRKLGDPSATSVAGNELGQIVGTPQFIAPETLRNAALNDPRSDLYSVGALGYFLLTGSYLFSGNTNIEICQKHLTDSPARPSTRTSEPVDPQFENLLLRCLAKDPAERPQSSRELAELLRANPHIHVWTPSRRTSWWMDHRSSIEQLKSQAEQRPPSETPPTVKITMSDRTL